ncbi:DUF3099 domain-containing protein [Kocuria turfanensis]|uniref:DUF3099 domain-containing protein n=1 Tax=Kocuria turfanensis TaxID=388357 RepID=A0A512IDJ8_9MICC|nr:DUF3099 domain-containing protein [Kocuria turfanensis]GEO95770.1 hypothetical protein KTU01_18930 [Kocuria turfanensis]
MSNRYLTTGETAGQDDVHSITATAGSHTQDMNHRMKVYSIQMGLRILCLIVFVAVDNIWVRGVAILGVAILPWMAVLLANSNDRSTRTSHYYEPPAAPALAAAPEPAPSAAPLAIDFVLEGEFTTGHAGDGDQDRTEGPRTGSTGTSRTAFPSGDPASSATVEDDTSRRRGAA